MKEASHERPPILFNMEYPERGNLWRQKVDEWLPASGGWYRGKARGSFADDENIY